MLATVRRTAPVVDALPDITVGASGPDGSSATYGNVFANDLVDGGLLGTCDHPPTSAYLVGTTLVTCTATDNHGNVGYGTFNVTVLPEVGGAAVERHLDGDRDQRRTHERDGHPARHDDRRHLRHVRHPGSHGGRVKVGGTTVGGLCGRSVGWCPAAA